MLKTILTIIISVTIFGVLFFLYVKKNLQNIIPLKVKSNPTKRKKYSRAYILYNEKNIFCMGTIGQLYQDMGGNVIILGKPSQEIYHEATKFLNSYKKSQMVAIGDSLFHDIKGANKFGIDNVLITSGIHSDYFSKKKPLWQSKKNQLLKYNIEPTYLSSEFIL